MATENSKSVERDAEVLPDSILDRVIDNTPKLDLYDRIADPTEAAERMGRAWAKSGMLGVSNEESGIVIAFTCIAEKITPLQYIRRYHTIGNKPSMRSDAMLAEFRMNHGGSHRKIAKTSDRAAIELTDNVGNKDVFELTWDEAADAGWPYRDKDDHTKGLKDNWDSKRGRQTMLWARVVSDAIRTVCPEVNAGIYTPEEMTDVLAADNSGQGLASNKHSSVAVEAGAATSESVVAPVEAASEEPSTMKQNMEMVSLFTELRISGEQLDAVLKKRDVDKIEFLSKKQANELLDKLRAKAREARGN